MPPGKIEDGSAIFDGTDLLKCNEDDLCKIRGKRISMIFQDPMTCLNPYLRISTQITEPLRIHMGMDKKTLEGEMNFVLTKGFGDVLTKRKVGNDRIAEEIQAFL